MRTDERIQCLTQAGTWAGLTRLSVRISIRLNEAPIQLRKMERDNG